MHESLNSIEDYQIKKVKTQRNNNDLCIKMENNYLLDPKNQSPILPNSTNNDLKQIICDSSLEAINSKRKFLVCKDESFENSDQTGEIEDKAKSQLKRIKRIQLLIENTKIELESMVNENICFDSTHYMFFDIEYFSSGKPNNSFEKVDYYPFQFTLMNYFGQGCVNEWIYYDKKILPEKTYNYYLNSLSRSSVNYDATIDPTFLEKKIINYMKKCTFLIGFGIKEDILWMKNILKIDLNRFNLVDLQKHEGFIKKEKRENQNYPENLKTLAETRLGKIIQREKGLHNAFEDSNAIRLLFIKEYENIKMKELQYNKWNI